MRLKNIAALVFRIIGASFILTGVADLIEAVAGGHDIILGVVESVGVSVLGSCLILYSKKVAALFCKGLDDEPAA